MKKFILSLAAIVLAAGFVSAQDLETATTTYNNGAEQLQNGDKAAALASFQEALKMGEACGEDGAELVQNCKNAIPNIVLSLGKDLVKDEDYEAAIAKIQEAADIAKEYGSQDVIDDAQTLIPQVKMQIGNKSFTAKDYPAAAATFKEVLAADPDNKNASLRLVQSLSQFDLPGATEALATAEANGVADNAKKVLGNAYLKEVQALNKANKQADAIALVDKAEELDIITNAAIFQLAGSAATKLNKISDAVKYYEKFLEADPDNKNAGAIAYTVGALYQQNLKDNTKALEFYKKAVAAGYADAQKMVDALSK